MSREDHDWRRERPRGRLRFDPPTPAPIPTPWIGPIPATATALPDPHGTPKQIEWARKIRARKWAGLLKAAKAADPASASADSRLRWLAASASAAWWIDHRELSPGKLWLAEAEV